LQHFFSSAPFPASYNRRNPLAEILRNHSLEDAFHRHRREFVLAACALLVTSPFPAISTHRFSGSILPRTIGFQGTRLVSSKKAVLLLLMESPVMKTDTIGQMLGKFWVRQEPIKASTINAGI